MPYKDNERGGPEVQAQEMQEMFMMRIGPAIIRYDIKQC